MMFDLTLSFDNGPDPGTTPAVLDALAERDIAVPRPEGGIL
jgi:peptidoglycan-N-acetylglucosamine deacetylase